MNTTKIGGILIVAALILIMVSGTGFALNDEIRRAQEREEAEANSSALYDPKQINEQLIQAAAEGDYDRVVEFLDYGADPDAANEAGTTALIWAAMNGRTDIVNLLIGEEADVNAKNKRGTTALQAAAAGNREEIVDILLNNGADPGLADNQGRTAYYFAEQNRSAVIEQRLKLAMGEPSETFPEKSMQQTALENEPQRAEEGTVVSVDKPDQCLRIRSGPGSRYDKIGCAAMGEKLKLTGVVQDNWAEVEGGNGWVFAGQLRSEGTFPAQAATSGGTPAYKEGLSRSGESWGTPAGRGSGISREQGQTADRLFIRPDLGSLPAPQAEAGPLIELPVPAPSLPTE